MVHNIDEIAFQALRLNKSERVILVDRLIRSLHDNIDSNVDQAWLDEVESRKQSLLDGTSTLLSEEDVIKLARNVLI